MKHPVLLLIDIQNDYFPGGPLELPHALKAAQEAARLLRAFRARGHAVVHVRHQSPPGSLPFLVQGSQGGELHSLVEPKSDEVVIDKQFPNAFTQTKLETTLRELSAEPVVICGMMTHLCVSSTARGAMELGFETIVATEATQTMDLQDGDALIPAAVVKQAHLAALAGFIAEPKLSAELLSLYCPSSP